MDEPLREVIPDLAGFLADLSTRPVTTDGTVAMMAIQNATCGDEGADKGMKLVYHMESDVEICRQALVVHEA